MSMMNVLEWLFYRIGGMSNLILNLVETELANFVYGPCLVETELACCYM
jgi:hypothetical protein